MKCLIRLDNTVDTIVMVAVVWSASDGVAITNTSRYTVSPVTGSFPTYNATLYISNLKTNDSGSYACNATASPDPPSPFIVSSGRQSAMLSISVGKTRGNMFYVQLVAVELLDIEFLYIDTYLSVASQLTPA